MTERGVEEERKLREGKLAKGGRSSSIVQKHGRTENGIGLQSDSVRSLTGLLSYQEKRRVLTGRMSGRQVGEKI